MKILNEKKKLLAIFVVAMVVLSFASIFFFIHGHDENEESQMETTYSIRITSPDDENYTLILPIPVDENGNPEPVLQDMQVVEGNGTFSVMHESYGWAIKIEGNKNLIIRGDGHYFSEPAVPSMVNSSGPPIQNPKYPWESEIPWYWNTTIYSDKKNISLNIHYYSFKDLGCYKSEGVTWGTGTWDEEKSEWNRTISIEKTGWVKIAFNVEILWR